MKILGPLFLSILFITSSFGQISITEAAFSYNQNFNSLSSSDDTWTDNSTIVGFYSTSSTYLAGNGSGTTGGLYSFGSTMDSDRALGSLASDDTGPINYGVRFVNNTGETITKLNVDYFGEQWRVANTSVHILLFSYQVNATDLTSGSWTDVPELDFLSPVVSATEGPLDGNASANRFNRSADINVNILNGDEIWFRWTDINDPGSDHGLSIDEFNLENIILPIKLASMNATNDNKTNTLNWQTSSEINNSHFEILHSSDARSYTIIGKEMGNGNTSENKSYSYDHQNVNSGTHYYQLRQVDYDGQSEIFGPVSVTVEGNTLRFYPTVAENTIHFDGLLDNENYAIYSVDGKTFQTGKVTQQIDISSIPNGVYYIRYGNETSQLIKL